MNELNGFDAAKLARLGRQSGLVHTKVLAKSRYHLGVLSRHPLRVLATERGGKFAHGLLCVEVLQTSLCVTHLNPHDSRRRADEARAILVHARKSADAARPFMLVGDLNTLSSLDRAAHTALGLTDKIRDGPYAKQLSKKFLNSAKSAVDYTPMQVLLDEQLTDVGAGSGHSVPTAINADHMHFATLRLDYCLVSQRLLDGCSTSRGRGEAAGRSSSSSGQPVARMLRDERANSLSDHFPLEVRFYVPDAG